MDWVRRVPYSLAVAGLTALLIGGVVGFAVAAGEADGIPLSFGVAEPRVGDRWQYDTETAIDAPTIDGLSFDDVELGRLHFYWADQGPWLDPEGKYHHVSHLVESWSLDGEEQSWTGYVIPADDAAAVAMYTNGSEPFSSSWTSGLPMGIGGSRETQGRMDFYEMLFVDVFDPYCGYRSDLQGAEITLADGVVFMGQCDPGDSLEEVDYPSSVVYKPHSVEDMGGMQTVRFHEEYRVEFLDAKLDLWVARHVPYPVKLAFFVSFDIKDLVPPQFWGELPDDSMVYVSMQLTMTGFEPGTAPLWQDTALPADRPVPTIQSAPRQIWGPADGGSGHPYPLSTAFQEARDDDDYSDLRSFLDRHPNAALTHATGWQQQTEDGLEHHWQFQVDDGREWITVAARKDPTSPPVEVPGLAQQRPRFETTDVQMGATVAPADRPAMMPTATSALARYSAMHGSANTWEVDLSQACCGGAVLRAGHREVESDPPETTAPITGQQATATSTVHVLGFSTAGTVVMERQETQQSTTVQQGLLPLDDAPPQATADKDPEPVPTTEAGVWSMPQQSAAAGVGLAAALAGILYYLWPLVKAGPAALFSRVHGDLLLDHPVRAELMGAVKATPGIHYQQLVREVGKGRGVVEHHLRKLQQSGFVVAHKTDGMTCYFPKGAVDRRVMAAMPVLKAPTAQMVLRAILGQPGTTQRDIAAMHGIAQSTVSHHVRRLVAAGVIERVPRGQEMALLPTSVAKDSLSLAAS